MQLLDIRTHPYKLRLFHAQIVVHIYGETQRLPRQQNDESAVVIKIVVWEFMKKYSTNETTNLEANGNNFKCINAAKKSWEISHHCLLFILTNLLSKMK